MPKTLALKKSEDEILSTLDDKDLEYHKFIVKQMQDAQQVMVNAQGASQSWGMYLANKYDMSQGDNVTAEGKINRSN